MTSLDFLPGFHILVREAAQDPYLGTIPGNFVSVTYLLAIKVNFQKNQVTIAVGLDNLIRMTPEDQLTQLADVIFKAWRPLSLKLRELAVPLLIPMPYAELVWNQFPSIIVDEKRLALIRIFRGRGYFDKLSDNHLYISPPI